MRAYHFTLPTTPLPENEHFVSVTAADFTLVISAEDKQTAIEEAASYLAMNHWECTDAEALQNPIEEEKAGNVGGMMIHSTLKMIPGAEIEDGSALS